MKMASALCVQIVLERCAVQPSDVQCRLLIYETLSLGLGDLLLTESMQEAQGLWGAGYSPQQECVVQEIPGKNTAHFKKHRGARLHLPRDCIGVWCVVCAAQLNLSSLTVVFLGCHGEAIITLWQFQFVWLSNPQQIMQKCLSLQNIPS